jgi:hypothetical protein
VDANAGAAEGGNMSMGIYLPNMEMPNTCYDCPFQTDECFGSIKCRYAKTWGSYSSRAVDCPLVPVPPHGRLIDGDKLNDYLKTAAIMADGEAKEAYIDARAEANTMPIIIPAEEGE